MNIEAEQEIHHGITHCKIVELYSHKCHTTLGGLLGILHDNMRHPRVWPSLQGGD